MPGRLGVYIHSDTSVPDKGGCILVVRTQTDFAARTEVVKKFADRAAMFCYGMHGSIQDLTALHVGLGDDPQPPPTPWEIVKQSFPNIDVERQETSALIGETIEVTDIVFVTV